MNISIRINYEAMCRAHFGLPYKGRFYETVELVLMEVTSSDAPVATITKGGTQTRWHRNHHYLIWRDQSLLEGAKGLTTSEALDIASHVPLYGINQGYDCFAPKERPVMFDSSRYTEFDYAPRDQAITEAQLCFDRILLVDDVIWIECAEPYLLKLMYDSKISYDLATLRHATRPNHRSHSWMLHADIQRADDPAAASDIEILIPESIQRQPERDTIIDAAMFLIEDYSYTYLSGVHPRVFSALGEVHSLYYGRPREEIDCDALVEPIQRLTYAMEHFETEERLANSGKISGYRNAVERWLDRRLSAVDILPAPGTASRL